MSESVGTAPAAAAEKILDPALKSFAHASEPGAKQSVIVELAVPAAEALRSVGVPPSPGRIPSGGKVDPRILTPHTALMDKLEGQIAEIVPRKPVRLNSAEAFVLKVNPEQLRALIELRLVGSVRPNRVRRV